MLHLEGPLNTLDSKQGVLFLRSNTSAYLCLQGVKSVHLIHLVHVSTHNTIQTRVFVLFQSNPFYNKAKPRTQKKEQQNCLHHINSKTEPIPAHTASMLPLLSEMMSVVDDPPAGVVLCADAATAANTVSVGSSCLPS